MGGIALLAQIFQFGRERGDLFLTGAFTGLQFIQLDRQRIALLRPFLFLRGEALNLKTTVSIFWCSSRLEFCNALNSPSRWRWRPPARHGARQLAHGDEIVGGKDGEGGGACDKPPPRGKSPADGGAHLYKEGRHACQERDWRVAHPDDGKAAERNVARRRIP